MLKSQLTKLGFKLDDTKFFFFFRYLVRFVKFWAHFKCHVLCIKVYLSLKLGGGGIWLIEVKFLVQIKTLFVLYTVIFV